jgi:lysozyme
MNISERGIKAIIEYEGKRLSAYRDSIGIPTIGVGHTKGVEMGDTITDDECEQFLREDLADAEKAVNQVPDLAQHEFDALTSLVFNIGTGNFNKSTLLRKLLNGDRQGAAVQFLVWDMAGGRHIPGLLKRRMAEASMFRGEP